MTLQNRIRAGGFIESEANGFRSRNQVTIHGGFTGAAVLHAGTVLGKITATGKYAISPATGSDGSQTAVAILFDDVDPTLGDIQGAVVDDDAEVRLADLTFDASVTAGAATTAKIAQLAAVGIKVRS